MGFGERIKKARLAKNIGQSDLAGRTGVSKTTVWAWENGTATTITGDNLIAVARVLSVTPEYIMTGKEINTELTPQDRELVELFHDLTSNEREHIIGLLRAIRDTRLVPPPPTFDYGDGDGDD